MVRVVSSDCEFGNLLSIATVSVGNLVKTKKANVCNSTRLELKNHHERHLLLHNVNHSRVIFDEFDRENMDGVICPEDGLIVYEKGDVECSIHSDHEDSDEEEDVPFL